MPNTNHRPVAVECTCPQCCYARKHPQLGPAPHSPTARPVTAVTLTDLRSTRFYAIDLDRRAIRAKPYPSERASTADGNGVAFRGSHLKRQPIYASFVILDESAWQPRHVTGPDGDNPITDEQIEVLEAEATIARDRDLETEARVALGRKYYRRGKARRSAARTRCAAAYNARRGKEGR